MQKKRLQLMIAGQTLKKRLQLIAALTALMLLLIISSQLLSEPQFKLSIVLTLICAAYVEYHRRKLVVESSRYTDRKLKQQARRFHGELWKIINFKPWGNEELETLMELQAEFRQIHPSDRYGTTDGFDVSIKNNESRKATTLNKG